VTTVRDVGTRDKGVGGGQAGLVAALEEAWKTYEENQVRSYRPIASR
jgi:hypothetical protein